MTMTTTPQAGAAFDRARLAAIAQTEARTSLSLEDKMRRLSFLGDEVNTRLERDGGVPSADEQQLLDEIRAEYQRTSDAAKAKQDWAVSGPRSRANRESQHGGATSGMDRGTVQPLRRDESFEERVRRTQRASAGGEGGRDEVNLGALMRAMALGPRTDAERRALAEGADSTGGVTVPAITSAAWIDLLRAQTICMRAGASVVPLESDQTTMAKLTADVAAGWRAENSLITEDEPTFGKIEFKPKSLAVLVKASRELLEDSVNIQQALTQSLTRVMALQLDSAALFGTGADSQPTGLYVHADVPSVTLGGTLAALQYAPLLDAIQALEEANAIYSDGLPKLPFDQSSDNPAVAFVMSPKVKKVFEGLTGSDGQYLLPPPALSGIRRISSSVIPNNLTVGGTTDCSAIFCGDWRALVFGLRSQLRVELLRERYADYHQVAFVAHLRADVQVSHPTAFVRLKAVK